MVIESRSEWHVRVLYSGRRPSAELQRAESRAESRAEQPGSAQARISSSMLSTGVLASRRALSACVQHTRAVDARRGAAAAGHSSAAPSSAAAAHAHLQLQLRSPCSHLHTGANLKAAHTLSSRPAASVPAASSSPLRWLSVSSRVRPVPIGVVGRAVPARRDTGSVAAASATAALLTAVHVRYLHYRPRRTSLPLFTSVRCGSCSRMLQSLCRADYVTRQCTRCCYCCCCRCFCCLSALSVASDIAVPALAAAVLCVCCRVRSVLVSLVRRCS